MTGRATADARCENWRWNASRMSCFCVNTYAEAPPDPKPRSSGCAKTVALSLPQQRSDGWHGICLVLGHGRARHRRRIGASSTLARAPRRDSAPVRFRASHRATSRRDTGRARSARRTFARPDATPAPQCSHRAARLQRPRGCIGAERASFGRPTPSRRRAFLHAQCRQDVSCPRSARVARAATERALGRRGPPRQRELRARGQNRATPVTFERRCLAPATLELTANRRPLVGS